MSGFDVHSPPFDRLSYAEAAELLEAIDIGYFRPGERMIEHGRSSEALHVIIKGRVEEREENGTVLNVFGAKDSFDSRAVVQGAAGADFVAAEETLCHLIPRRTILGLVERNPAFAGFFYAEISRKLEALSSPAGHGVASVLHARVSDAHRARAVFVPATASVLEVGMQMRENDVNALFVQDGDRVGVITGMNLSKALILYRLPLDTPVRDFCHFDLVSVHEDDFIFEALIRMTRHNKRRLAVRSDSGFVGFLEDIDLLGLFAGNSQLIPSRIDRSRDVNELGEVAGDIQAQVERLQREGVRVEVIAEITSDLNRRLFAKLFELLATPSIREHGCLMLMGSEGRGEQVARTDQDNGLLLDAPIDPAELDSFRDAFTAALDRFGFPRCPGGVMVSNPVWSQPLDSFIQQLRTWVMERTPESAMNLAIFYDAVAVGGRTQLLAQAKAVLVDFARGEAMLLAHMAHLMESFETPSLSGVGALLASVVHAPDTLDVKRSGIFPIVHGIRTLALEHGVLAEPTVARIDALVNAGALAPDLGRELVSALHVFMGLRLRSQLTAIRRGNLEGESLVRTSELSPADRDILRDALRITRRFRETVRHHYNLRSF